MKIVSWDQIGSEHLAVVRAAATIGVFDGVHRGHQSLLEELVGDKDPSDASVVVTFRENPKKLFNANYPGDLMTWEEKVVALSDLGVDQVVVIDFSAAFSRMSGRDFFLMLKKSFVFSRLVLGWNFSFGRDSATTAADLGWLADAETRLTILPPKTAEGQVISSSAVREAIATGNLVWARTLLGRPYAVPLQPPFRWRSGRCTVDRGRVGKLMPPPGNYAVRLDGRTANLTVNEKFLSWESPPGVSFNEVVFE